MNPPTHGRLPLQSAQAGGRLAESFSPAQRAALFDMRCARQLLLSQTEKVEAEENKVVRVIAWLEVSPFEFSLHKLLLRDTEIGKSYLPGFRTAPILHVLGPQVAFFYVGAVPVPHQ